MGEPQDLLQGGDDLQRPGRCRPGFALLPRAQRRHRDGAAAAGEVAAQPFQRQAALPDGASQREMKRTVPQECVESRGHAPERNERSASVPQSRSPVFQRLTSNEGGASAAALPQEVFAVEPSSTSRVPPFRNDSGSHGFVEVWPLTRRLWTNLLSGDAPGAEIVSVTPFARCTTILSNSGLPSSSSPRPGASGCMPMAAQTYHADMAPRSSWPGIPSGALDHNVFTTSRTVSWVLYGVRVKSYSHGAVIDGSLFISALSPPAPVSAKLPSLLW